MLELKFFWDSTLELISFEIMEKNWSHLWVKNRSRCGPVRSGLEAVRSGPAIFSDRAITTTYREVEKKMYLK